MLHVVAIAIFAVVFTKWLAYELAKPVSIKQHAGWIVDASGSALVAAILDWLVGGKLGNFILHGLGGGVASAFVYIFLIKTFRPAFSWRVHLVMLFAFVSMLGVMNELYEYAAEAIGIAIMSIDTHDTWRDFTANTMGALIAWAGFAAWQRISTGKKQG